MLMQEYHASLIQTRGSSVCLTHRCHKGTPLDRITRFPLEAALVRVHFLAVILLSWSCACSRNLLTRAIMSLILKSPSDIGINA